MSQSQLDFRLAAVVTEKARPGRVIWAVGTSALCADGSFLFATAGGSNVVLYIALADGRVDILEELEDADPEENLYAVAFGIISPSRHVIATAGENSAIKLYDVSLRTLCGRLTGHGDCVNHLAWVPRTDGHLLSGSNDESVRLWDARRGLLLGVFGGLQGHRGAVLFVDPHATGTCFASAGQDNSIRVWDLRSPALVSAYAASLSFPPAAEASRPFSAVDTATPAFATMAVHNDYVDSVHWLGDVLLSKCAGSGGAYKSAAWVPDPARGPGGVSVLFALDRRGCDVWFMKQSTSLQPGGHARVALGTIKGDVMVWDLGSDVTAAMARAEGGIAAAWAALRASAAEAPPSKPKRDSDGGDAGLSVPWRWQLEDPTVPVVSPCRVLDASPLTMVASRAVAFGPGGDSLIVALETGAVQRWICVGAAAGSKAARAHAVIPAPAAVPHPASAQTPQLLRELQLSTSAAEVAYYRALLRLNQRILAADAALVSARLARGCPVPPALASICASRRRSAASIEGGGGGGGFLVEFMLAPGGGGAAKDAPAGLARAPPAQRSRVFPACVRLSVAHLGGPPPPPRQRRQLWSQSNVSVTAHDQVEIFHLPYGSDHADYREQLIRSGHVNRVRENRAPLLARATMAQAQAYAVVDALASLRRSAAFCSSSERHQARSLAALTRGLSDVYLRRVAAHAADIEAAEAAADAEDDDVPESGGAAAGGRARAASPSDGSLSHGGVEGMPECFLALTVSGGRFATRAGAAAPEDVPAVCPSPFHSDSLRLAPVLGSGATTALPSTAADLAALAGTAWRYDGGAACSLCGAGVVSLSAVRGVVAGGGAASSETPVPPPPPPAAPEATSVAGVLHRYSTRLVVPPAFLRFTDAPAAAPAASAAPHHPAALPPSRPSPTELTSRTVAATLPFRALWCSLCARFACVVHAASEVPDPLQAAAIWAHTEVPHALAHDLAATSRADTLMRASQKKPPIGGRVRRRKVTGKLNLAAGKRAKQQLLQVAAAASGQAAGAVAAAAAGADDGDADDGGGSSDDCSDDDDAARQASTGTPEGSVGLDAVAARAGGAAEFAAVTAGMRSLLKLPPTGGASKGPCGESCYLSSSASAAAAASPLAPSEAAMLPRLHLMAQGDWCVVGRLLGRPCSAVYASAVADGIIDHEKTEVTADSLVHIKDAPNAGLLTAAGDVWSGALPVLAAARAQARAVLALKRRPFLVRQGCCCPGNCGTRACPCFTAGRECDPSLCHSCGAADSIYLWTAPGADKGRSSRVPVGVPQSSVLASCCPPPEEPATSARASGVHTAIAPLLPASFAKMTMAQRTELLMRPEYTTAQRCSHIASIEDPAFARQTRQAFADLRAYCRNVSLQSHRRAHAFVGASLIPDAGLGLFLAEAAGAGDLIGEYTGEIITSAEADRRGVFYDEVFDRSYLFGVEEDVCLDAQYVGCKVRFANHSHKAPNCEPRVLNVRGERRIGLYVKSRPLEAGTELLFDYGDSSYGRSTPHRVAWLRAGKRRAAATSSAGGSGVAAQTF